MSLVMALPAGQEEHQHHHHETHGPHHNPKYHIPGPMKDWKTEKDGRPARVDDGYKVSMGVMVLSWVLGLVVFATELLWKQPQIGLVQLTNLPSGDGSEGLLIASTGVYYRPSSDRVWHGTYATFGSSQYLDEDDEGLPDYAQDLAYVLGGPRTIMPSFLIAYAFGLLLALLLGASTAVIAEMVGPNFMHKHHHIYRPMLLKSCVCFLAYTVGINMVALMVPWTIKSSVDDYNGAKYHVKAVIDGGLWMLLLSLFLHISALVSGFHLIAKQRMHLRHPGWVIAAYEHERRRRYHQHHHEQLQQASKPPSFQGSTGSQITLVDRIQDGQIKPSVEAPPDYPNKGAFPQGASYADDPYGAERASQKQTYDPLAKQQSQAAKAEPNPVQESINSYAAQQASQYYSSSETQKQANIPITLDQGTYGAPQGKDAGLADGFARPADNESASVYPLKIKRPHKAQGATGQQSLSRPTAASQPDSSAPTGAPQGEAAGYYQASLARSQKSKRAPPPPAPSTMNPFPKGNYSNMYGPQQ